VYRSHHTLPKRDHRQIADELASPVSAVARPEGLARRSNRGYKWSVRIIYLATLTFLVGCVDLSKICPSKPITQGVFGEIVDSNNALEENVNVDLYTMTNGVQAALPTYSRQTTRGGYQIDVLPSMYILCAKTVCSPPVTVPTGVVELSAVDATAGLTWDAPVAVPPAQTIGPCTWGD
jgi:hypothetical protein